MPSVINGARGTGNESGAPTASSINPERRVKDVSEKIHLLDADQNPLVVFVKKAGKKVATNPKFRWQEDQFEPKSLTLNAAALAAIAANNSASFTVEAGEEHYATVGDLIVVPGTAGAAPNNYDEMLLVTAVNAAGDSVTVSRFSARAANYDLSGLADPFTVYMTGSAFAEGSSAADAKSTKVQFKENYTEIFKDAFAVTGTEDASELYGGPDRPRLRRKKGLKHMRDIERAFILGQPKEDVSGSYPRRATGGALHFIQSNVVNAGGNINYQTWVDFAEDVFRYGDSPSRLLLASAEVVSAIDLMAHNEYFSQNPENVFGVNVKRITTSHGDFLLTRHKQFGDMGLAGYALALDMQDVKYRFLQGRDTRFFADIQLPGDDVMKDQYLTECGLEFPLEQRSGVLKGVTGFAP